MLIVKVFLLTLRRRRFAGAELGSRVLQGSLNPRCVRVRATKHAPRDAVRVLERTHGLAEIVERGAFVIVERLRVIQPQRERETMIVPEYASRHGYRFT